MQHARQLLMALVVVASLGGCQATAPSARAGPPPDAPPEVAATPPVLGRLVAPVSNYRVVARYPHDPSAFTQGLVVGPAGTLYEGTGQKGQSELRQVELESGQVLRRQKLADEYFGEGLARLAGHLYQLTWQGHKGFIYAESSFKEIGQFGYLTEGWGLTDNGQGQLWMSDGSATLSLREPKKFAEVTSIQVKDGDVPITNLNELEWVNGQIWANVWTTEYVAMIDPASGKVLGWLDLRGLLSHRERAQADVLNGIAYDSQHDRLFVTGKLWPTLFEIQVVPPRGGN